MLITPRFTAWCRCWIVFRRHKRAVGCRWRMDETYTKIKEQWKYLSRTADTAGHHRLSADSQTGRCRRIALLLQSH